jgi:magnesium-transporting ATPase (P-type)
LLQYTRVKGGDCIDKTLKFGLYILLAYYEVCMVGVLTKYAWTYPEFRPATSTECEALFINYILGDWSKWNQNYQKSVHILNIALFCFGFLSALLTSIGVFLIYRFVKKIVSFYQNQIKINWMLFIVHFAIVAILCASEMIFILKPKNNLSFYFVLGLSAVDQLMICYIVATYSKRKEDPLFI